MPVCDVGRTGNALGEFIWGIEFLVLNELTDFLCAVDVIMEFEEAEFSRPDCSTNKLIDIALILGIEEELPGFILLVHVFLELLFVLNDVLQHQLFFGSILTVCDIVTFFGFVDHVLELPAPLHLLVDDIAALAPVFCQERVVIELRVHLAVSKYLKIILLSIYPIHCLSTHFAQSFCLLE